MEMKSIPDRLGEIKLIIRYLLHAAIVPAERLCQKSLTCDCATAKRHPDKGPFQPAQTLIQNRLSTAAATVSDISLLNLKIMVKTYHQNQFVKEYLTQP